MAYQVGFICYSTKLQAEDVYYSKVVPYVTDSGLFQPIRQPDGWYFQGVKLSAGLPQCDPVASFSAGAEMGGMLLLPLAVAWGFIIIRRILR